MREFEERDKKINSLLCSICHNKNIDIKQKYSKIEKVFTKTSNNNELSKIIKRCNCDNNNNNNKKYIVNENDIYTHKYCILNNIIFNFEIKCQKCNTLYNIKIDKKIHKRRVKLLIITFFIIYIIHLCVYLLCMFLLFINIILKNYIIRLYRHLFVFLGIFLLVINTIFFYFSIINNIKKCKKDIYKFTIDILDILEDTNTFKNIYNINSENDFFNLILEFYEWFYNQSMKHLINKIHKININNRLNFIYNDTLLEYIQKNNSDFISINKKEYNNNTNNNIIDIKEENKSNNNLMTKEMRLNKNIANVIINKNILNINSKNFQSKDKD